MRSFGLNAKMALVFTILIAGSVVIALLGITRMAGLSAALEEMVNVSVVRAFNADEIQGDMRYLVVQEKNLILADTDESRASANVELDKYEAETQTDLDRSISQTSPTNMPKWQSIKEKYAAWVKANNRLRDFVKKGDIKSAMEITAGESRTLRKDIEKIAEDLVEINRATMATKVKEAEDSYQSARLLMIIASLIAVVAGLVVAVLILRAVSRSINDIIAKLTENSVQVTDAAQQIASSSTELSSATTEQAASLQETSAAVEELSSMVKTNAASAKQSADLSHVSRDTATRGKQVVADMIKAMNDIDHANAQILNQVNASNQSMAEITKVIAEIGNKTKVINDIVFQTKLLSFNASVEAARAGEHGKGFAVVAEEVGNLAQMSGNAAREISQMLEGSIRRVESIAADSKTGVEALVREGKAKVDVGTQVAQECSRVLDEIVDNVGSVARMSGDISNATSEQARGLEEINRAMSQLDQVTQQNATVSEQASGSAEALARQAEMLRNVVEMLATTIKGGVAAEGAHAAAAAPAPARTKASAPASVQTRAPARVLTMANRRPAAATTATAPAPAMAVGEDIVPAAGDKRFTDV